MENRMTRRGLMMRTAALGAIVTTGAAATAMAKPNTAAPATEAVWLDRAAPAYSEGMTFGVPWPRGTVSAKAGFTLGDLPLQSLPIAYWPDGSLKW